MNDNNIKEFCKSLRASLLNIASSTDKAWLEKYMKGVITFHGVKVPKVRSLTSELIKKEDLKSWPEQSILQLTGQLIESNFSEEKLVAALILTDRSIKVDDWRGQVNLLHKAFQVGHIADWATCDQVCMGVLHRQVEVHGQIVAEEVSSWAAQNEATLWARRASAVTFVKLAPKCPKERPWLIPIILDVCGHNVRSKERFLQTATGWLLRQFGVGSAKQMLAFVEKNLAHFSREGLKYALEKTPATKQKSLMNKHKLLLSKIVAESKS